MVRFFIRMLLIGALGAGACRQHSHTSHVAEVHGGHVSWEKELSDQLPLFGHRNWILVVDKAFPLQAAAGMTYVNSKGNLPEVLSLVLDSINATTHVRPVLYRDAEMTMIDETLVPGIGSFKQHINAILQGQAVQELAHEDIFGKMDEAAALFQVLVIKTETKIPYSSIFIELDCAYWDAEREQQLRKTELRHAE
ncbi:RbsD/FucU domain-containing protein [Parapedobacter indicus]|uniref:D-ribose pyranase n=1 Tax=Parapedobacter indicus TaxID=1477437 RepID=A0A1I3IM76_9SPHI|nr:RbsD/FucU domain-containing protein [Parapedobacter indicus]PPL02219.1 RbsD/FucU transport protein family protein [Parapedobacter indicus]SFI48883.1 RbsD / FucU transport protein family protein [Parapedobacter indicus]